MGMLIWGIVRGLALWLVFSVLVVLLALVVGAVAGATPQRAAQTSHPLDCIHWRILGNGGSGPLVRVLVCSSLPKDQGGDSPARDSTNWATLIVDGDAFTTQGCGRSWTTGVGPCVVEGP